MMRDDRRRLPWLDAARGHLRAVAPPLMWIPFLLWLIVAEGAARYLEWRFGVVRFNLPVRPDLFAIYFEAALLGGFRAIMFHPQRDSAYRDWLSRTPWTAARPLPRGPIHLAWPDVLVVGALILAGTVAPDVKLLWIICIYLFAYCLIVAFLTLATLTFVPAYLALFLLGFMARFRLDPWTCAAFGVVSYLATYWGIRRSLRFFPWPLSPEVVALSEGFVEALGGVKTSKLGWPYQRLLVDPARGPDEPKLVLHSFLGCALIAWWLSCALAGADDPDDRKSIAFMSALGYLAVFLGMLFRIGLYFAGYAAPISPAGRIGARRLIAPGYDQAFLVFPLMILAPATVTQIGWAAGIPPSVYAPIAPALVPFIALATPPGLRRWRLVGRHRMTPAIAAQDKRYVKVG